MQPEPQQVSDEELARQAAAGSSDAFDTLASRWERPLFEFLQRRARCAHDAEDLAQQVFVSVWRNLRRFDPSRRFGPWIYAVARRALVDHWRAAARRPALVEEGAAPEARDVRDPARAAGAGDAEADLWTRASELLSASQFETLWMHARGEMPVADIARATGRTRTHVKVLLFRARRSLVRARLHESSEAAGLREAAAMTPAPAWPAGAWNGGRGS